MSHSPPSEASNLPSSIRQKSIFFIGSTGYIGGTVLQKLLALTPPPQSITLFLRDSKKAELLEKFTLPSGTKLDTFIGSLEEHDKLTKGAEEHDIVVQTANADDLGAMTAILEGMKKRQEKTGHRGLLIHTSGTGVLTDDAKGMYPNDIIYTDLNPTPATSTSPALRSMADLPDDALHRPVDLAIINADAAGSIKSYIILPSTIWGEGKGELFDMGFSNPFSQQIPGLIRAGLDRKQAGMVGKGANIWPHVDISDVGDLYALVYAGALRSNIGHGAAGYYFGISGEYTYLAVVSTIGSTLVKHKWAETSEPKTFTKEEIDQYFEGSDYLGSNSRGVADRSKSIGWRPRYKELEDLMDHVKKEVVRVEAKYGKSFGN